VEGFYEDIRALTDDEKSWMAEVPFIEEEYLRETGSPSLFGEPGFTTCERAWVRPTLEVNGIYGGFQGEGVKTVLPSEAHAKISCRLVPDQDPSKMADLVLRHIKTVTPPGVKVTAVKAESGAMPYLIPSDHKGLQVTASVLKELYGKDPYRIRMGAIRPMHCSSSIWGLRLY
jgi:acetylornithine deacetylase/succinyl-diaminopimelate desuccinylase-like protein